MDKSIKKYSNDFGNFLAEGFVAANATYNSVFRKAARAFAAFKAAGIPVFMTPGNHGVSPLCGCSGCLGVRV